MSMGVCAICTTYEKRTLIDWNMLENTIGKWKRTVLPKTKRKRNAVNTGNSLFYLFFVDNVVLFFYFNSKLKYV